MHFMKDKDYRKAVSLLAPCCEKMVFTNVDTLRGEAPEVLCQAAEKYCGDCEGEADVQRAFELALSKAQKDDILLVCGSFYLVSEIRKIILSR